jgi:protein-L-isoaspartate(D-aspartate) O-methyltransferase
MTAMTEATRAPGRSAELLRQIEAEGREVAALYGLPPIAPRVLEALAAVPREEFVPAGDEPYAYANVPLPIGHGQTISQPFIVACMTTLLDIEPTDVVLEVGTGSGYQAAVLARLCRHVYTVEIIGELAERAAGRLTRLGYVNVTVRHHDGFDGWPEHGPYDGIIVTAAAPDVPPPLVVQLKPEARLVLPIESHMGQQDLTVVTKDAAGRTQLRPVLPVAFVPLTRARR